jgi:hypothetical protein
LHSPSFNNFCCSPIGERKSTIGDAPVSLSIQPTKNGEAKAYQVKQFLKIQEEENEANHRGF